MRFDTSGNICKQVHGVNTENATLKEGRPKFRFSDQSLDFQPIDVAFKVATDRTNQTIIDNIRDM